MLLLVGAFLLMGSLSRLLRVDPGFDVRDIVTVPLHLPESTYSEGARQVFFRETIARLEALPSIESASATATNPFREWGFANDVTPEDLTPRSQGAKEISRQGAKVPRGSHAKERRRQGDLTPRSEGAKEISR